MMQQMNSHILILVVVLLSANLSTTVVCLKIESFNLPTFSKLFFYQSILQNKILFTTTTTTTATSPYTKDNRIERGSNDKYLLAFQFIDNLIGGTITTSATDKVSKDIIIREAIEDELSSVVNLRMRVFFPEYTSSTSFHVSILDKIKDRRQTKGTKVLIAKTNKTNNDDDDSDDDDSSRRLLNMISSFDDVVGSIEVSSNDFIGTVLETLGSTKKLYIADLCIRHDVRRLGIATKLLKQVECIAYDSDCKELYLHVEKDNDVAKNLYMKNGYQTINEMWSSTFTEQRLNQPHDLYILMKKSI